MSVTLDYFKKLYHQYGLSSESLGWSKLSQHKRFQAVASLLPEEFNSLLDVGCGFGDFAIYLNQFVKRDFAYTGIDIIPEFIEAANKALGTFLVQDVMNYDPEKKFDCIVAIGAFNVETGENDVLLEKAISKLVYLATDCVIISCLSAFSPLEYKSNRQMHFFNPFNFYKYSQSIGCQVDLIHTHLPHDFILKIKK